MFVVLIPVRNECVVGNAKANNDCWYFDYLAILVTGVYARVCGDY